MVSLKRLAAVFAVSIAASTVLTTIAEAQSRRGPLRITVQKRSFFDAGNVVPVGSMNRYASQHFASAPAYSSFGGFYGEDTLPSRIGAGANPFANTFETPRF